MTRSLVTLDGNAASHLAMHIPAWGCWWADVSLVEPVELDVDARVSLAIGDTVASGTAVAGGALDARAAYRIVGGANGWSQQVSAKGYRNTAGVAVSKVLTDLAESVGETLANTPTTLLDEHYTRPRGGAYLTLNSTAPQAWYVGLDGATVIGSRAAATYIGDGAITRRDKAAGVVEVETTDVSQLVPGIQVDGNPPATDVEIVLADNRLTARVYYSPATTRRLRAFDRLLSALDPRRKFRGIFEYRVVLQSGDRLDLQAVRAASDLPDLRGVPVRPGMAGLRADAALGSLVLVVFVDSNPSRPAVIAHTAPDAPGWMPTLLELGGPVTLPVARQTDAVVAGAFAGTVTGGSLVVRSA